MNLNITVTPFLLLQNPYLINGHKINLRCYVLVVCKNKEINVHFYNDGFMYYTPKKFVKNNTDPDVNITTGYIDREIYDFNPLTHNEFKLYLNQRRKLNKTEDNIRSQGLSVSQVCFDRIKKLIKDVHMAFVGKICVSKKLNNNVIFQIIKVQEIFSSMLF